jgi:hypothetical protein
MLSRRRSVMDFMIVELAGSATLFRWHMWSTEGRQRIVPKSAHQSYLTNRANGTL